MSNKLFALKEIPSCEADGCNEQATATVFGGLWFRRNDVQLCAEHMKQYVEYDDEEHFKREEAFVAEASDRDFEGLTHREVQVANNMRILLLNERNVVKIGTGLAPGRLIRNRI